MLMNIMFYAVIACFAIAALAWIDYKLTKMSFAGSTANAFFVLGLTVLLARLIAFNIQDSVFGLEGMVTVFALVLAICGMYMHLRLGGKTVVLPVAAVVIVAAVFSESMMPSLAFWMPLFKTFDLPWAHGAAVWSAIGVGAAIAYIVVLLSALIKKNKNDARMQKVMSRFGWWTLLSLTLGMGAYMLWCQTVFGVYWVWQPFFAVTALAWLVVFVGKDPLNCRK